MGPGPWPLVSSEAPGRSQHAPLPGEGRACPPRGQPQGLCSPSAAPAPAASGPRGPGSPGPPSLWHGPGGEASPDASMFFYWKKRGAYELEALPSGLAELELGAVERFSWSSTLDIIEDLRGRCRPASPKRALRGLDIWSTWLPSWGQSLWPIHCARAPALPDPTVAWDPGPLLRAATVGERGLSTRTLGPQGQRGQAKEPLLPEGGWAGQRGPRSEAWNTAVVLSPVLPGPSLCPLPPRSGPCGGIGLSGMFMFRPQDTCFSHYPHCR